MKPAATTLSRPEVFRLDPAFFERWAELLDLIRRSFASMDGVVDPPSSMHRLSLESLAAKARTEEAFLVQEEGRVVGCAFVADRGDRLYVGKLAVDPRRQGQGIGRALLEAVEAYAAARSVRLLELQTRVELRANHAVFARWGFRETGRTAHPGYDRPTSITMQKVLSP